MLLEFKTSNYKSFKDELVFSLVPAPKQKGLDYSILEENIVGKKIQRFVFSCYLWAKCFRKDQYYWCNGHFQVDCFTWKSAERRG